MRDLVIAGGGPVGLVAALHAARAGLDVVVREPRRPPVDKACGEGLMPGAVAALAEVGVDPPGVAITGIRYVDDRESAVAEFRHGPGRGVRRTALSGALWDAVTAAGVEVVARPVEAVEQHDDHVLVDGEPAGHLIAADGLHSRVRRLVGAESPLSGPKRYGLRAHADLAPWTSEVEVHWSRRSEAYVTPVGAHEVGLAVLSDRPAPFAELLAGHRRLSERFAGVTFSPVRGAGPLRQRVTRRVVGRTLLVGDAAGYLDAITGEGIALGLAQAAAAVEAVAAGCAEDYENAYRRLGRRHQLLTQALLTGTRVPAVRRLIVPAAARLPRVFGAAVDQLARPA